MKQFLILAVVVVVAVARRHNSLLDEHWELFKGKFGKAYASNEESFRRQIWESNVALIAKHNREYDLGKHTFNLGLNQYADMTNREFVERMNGYQVSSKPRTNPVFQPQNKDVPDTVDWRTKKIVTDIKDQGQCGSCWAFSTTGSVEGQHALATGKLVSLSEQELVDCSQKEGNQGCNGGLMDQGFQYIIDNKGLDTEDSYPYTAEDDKCKSDPSKVGATVKGFVDVKSGSEDDLKQAVASVGPVSVAIDASSIFFQLYRSGVYTDPFCSTTSLDHGVLAVGYGTDNKKDYWLVKNSWGTSWGMQGYIKMARNHSNMCGIATQASYPKV